MRTIYYLLQKEFVQIFRNKVMVPIIFLLPLLQMLVLVYAATFEMKNIDMIVVDHDMSQYSRDLTSKFAASPFYRLRQSISVKEATTEMHKENADIILVIPAFFERELIKEESTHLQLLINAINSSAAGVMNAYTQSVIADFNRNIRVELLAKSGAVNTKQVLMEYAYWYNPELNYKIYMLPGILVILVTIIGMFLTALNLVREKEMGTIEQINVTPIKKYQFIVGKLVPFWIIALFELAFGLTVGKILFDIPMEGSLFLLFGFASIYLIVALGLGLFLSAISQTQQQVMFIAFFFMISFVLMSGIFTPAESMPRWAQQVNVINPLFYFMKVIRMILLKGSGLNDILKEVYSLSIYGVIVLSLAIWRYRKTV